MMVEYAGGFLLTIKFFNVAHFFCVFEKMYI